MNNLKLYGALLLVFICTAFLYTTPCLAQIFDDSSAGIFGQSSGQVPKSSSSQIFDRSSDPVGHVFDSYSDQESTFDIHAELGVFSNRVFRGQNLYDGPSLQPRLRAAANIQPVSIHLGIFSHVSLDGDDTKNPNGDPFETTDENGNVVRVQEVVPAFTELDYDVGAEINFDLLRLDFGHRWYSYSKETWRLDNTAEVYGAVELDCLLHPRFSAAYDWDTFQGWYFEIGLLEEIFIDSEDRNISVIPSVAVGFSSGLDNDDNDEKRVYEGSGVVFVGFGLAGVFHLTDEIYLQPKVEYIHEVDDFANSTFTLGLVLAGDLAW